MAKKNKKDDVSVSKDSGRTGTLRKVANLRMLAITAIVLALIVPVSYAWHTYQWHRTSEMLSAQAADLQKIAKESQDPKNWAEAARRWDHYLQRVPDDLSAEIESVKCYDKSIENRSAKGRVVARYQVLLGKMDNSHLEKEQLTHRLLELLLETRQYGPAERLADELIQQKKLDPAAWKAKALALYVYHQKGTLPAELEFIDVDEFPKALDLPKDFNLATVADVFLLAFELNDRDPFLGQLLAAMHRDNTIELIRDGSTKDARNRFADEIIDKMVKADADNPEVHLVRYQYRDKNEINGAEDDLKRALQLVRESLKKIDNSAEIEEKLGRKEYNVCIEAGKAAATLAVRRKRALGGPVKAEKHYNDAVKCFRDAISIEPQFPEGYVRLGDLYRYSDQPEKAIDAWREGLQRIDEPSGRLDLDEKLAEAFIDGGQLDQAEKALDRLDEGIRHIREYADASYMRTLETKRNVLRGRWYLGNGNPAEAIKHLSGATIDPGITPQEKTTAAQAWITIALAQSKLNNWLEAAKTYEKAIVLQPQYIHLQIGALEAWKKAGNTEQVDRIEEKLQQPVVSLAELYLQRRDEKVLDNLETQFKNATGDSGLLWKCCRVPKLVVRAKSSRDPLLAEADKLLKEIQTKQPDQAATHHLAGLLAARKGKPDDAIAAYREAIKKGDKTLFVYQHLVRQLIASGQLDEAQKLLDDLGDKVPLADGLVAAQMTIYSQQGKSELVMEIAKKSLEARPNDPVQYRRMGRLLEMDKKLDEAESSFRKAEELAPDNLAVLADMFRFFMATSQEEKAEEVVATIGGNENIDELQRTMAVASCYQRLAEANEAEGKTKEGEGKTEEAKTDAEKAKAALQKVEAALQKAVGLAPDNLGVLAAQFRFYAGSNKEKAEAVLAKISANEKIEELPRTLAVADCQQQLGNAKEAEAAYRKAVKLEPDNLAIEARLVGLLLSQPVKEKQDEAKRMLEAMLQKQPDSVVLQRALARAKALRGTDEERKEACEILERLSGDPEQGVDLDNRYLAGLYESQKKIDEANKEYLKLVEREQALPGDIDAYIRFLMRNKRSADAGPWLDILEKKAPDNLRLAALRLQWLKDEGKDDQIEAHIKKTVERLKKDAGDDKAKQATASFVAGNFYAVAENMKEAEKHYRELLKHSPQAIGPLVNVISKQGRRPEAVKMCVKAAKEDDSINTAVALISILLVADPNKEEMDLAEPVISKALEANKDNMTFVAHVATLRVVQKRIAEAIELYRKVLEERPKDLTSLNNLASLLGEVEDEKTREEAIELADRAIAIAGQAPGLLDTKATIRLYQGKTQKAIDLLEQATARPDADPRFFFHLALAYQKSGNKDKAEEAFAQAEKNGLKENILTPKEQETLAQLEKDLQKNKK